MLVTEKEAGLIRCCGPDGCGRYPESVHTEEPVIPGRYCIGPKCMGWIWVGWINEDARVEDKLGCCGYAKEERK